MSRRASFVLPFLLTVAASQAATLNPGETRTAEGIVSAVDVAHRAVVLEVATPKGDLTVGVTLEEQAVPRAGDTAVSLGDIRIGEKARLKYTRKDDRLVGLDLELKR